MKHGKLLVISSIGVCLGVLLGWYRDKRAQEKEIAAINEITREAAAAIRNGTFYRTNNDSENTDLEGVSDN